MSKGPINHPIVPPSFSSFDIRKIHRKGKGLSTPFWIMSRPTAYRLVKRVMDRANIKGKQATGKGLRHSFDLAMLSGSKPLPIHILAQLMSHSSTKTSEFYLQAVGDKKRTLVLDAWKEILCESHR